MKEQIRASFDECPYGSGLELVAGTPQAYLRDRIDAYRRSTHLFNC